MMSIREDPEPQRVTGAVGEGVIRHGRSRTGAHRRKPPVPQSSLALLRERVIDVQLERLVAVFVILLQCGKPRQLVGPQRRFGQERKRQRYVEIDPWV